MPNQTINSISPDLRDALLNRNLIPFTESTSVSGLGLPVSIELNQPLASASVTTIDDNANEYRNQNIIKNSYKSEGIPEEIDITSFGLVGTSNTDFVNGTYQTPSLEDSPLSDALSSFPYVGITPLKYLSTKNLYNDPTQQVDVSPRLINLSPITDQIKSYLDEKGSVRGLPPQTAADVIGTLLSGRQLGYSPNGPEPNFDIRSSIVGRVLAPTIGDTPLGLIGSQQLLNAMLSNAGANLQQETLGRINVTSLFDKNNDFIIPNYDITVRDGDLGKAYDFWENLTGTQFPSSNIIKDDASIFTMDSPKTNSEQRSQNLLSKYTGRGQANALFSNLRNNLYTPEYSDERSTNQGLKDVRYSSTVFIGLNDIIINYDSIPTELYIEKNECDDENLRHDNKNNEFTWLKTSESYTPPNLIQANIDLPTLIDEKNPFNSSPNSLLYKTQNLFNSGKITSIINDTSAKAIQDEIQSSIVNGQMSKGSAVVCDSGDFCRTWTTFRRYNRVKNLQKNEGLYQNNNGSEGNYTRYRKNANDSVLDSNGFVKISPYKSDKVDDVKKYMFSIENLAWADRSFELMPCEKGNGDPTDTRSSKVGRIMWFPPYDISFTDTVAVDWTSTNFIGRGEPIYTYNNTERTGTLSFKIIIDHASWMNESEIRSNLDDSKFASINAGCSDIPDVTWDISDVYRDITEVAENITPEETATDLTIYQTYKYYFPNNNSEINLDYENGIKEGNYYYFDDNEYFPKGRPSSKNVDDGLNLGSNALLPQLTACTISDILKNCESCKIYIKGWASEAGDPLDGKLETRKAINLRLSKDRAAAVGNLLFEELIDEIRDIESRIMLEEGYGETNVIVTENQDELLSREQRYVTVEIRNVPIKSEELECENRNPNSYRRESGIKRTKQNFYSECQYFEKLAKEDSFAYENIKQYVKFFHPAFHSTTPEGFNSRLTFLHQCTRQGPSLNTGEPSNLAFGRPPVCILRIGDFYYTKIIIDNLSYTFEPIVWDLNPEGVGVQPMIAHVDISFKFIGGSSLQGPINKLQNAVSFNFFANTGLYDTRADILSERTYNAETGAYGARTIITGFSGGTTEEIYWNTPVNNLIENSASSADVAITNTNSTSTQFNSDLDEINAQNGAREQESE